VERSLALTFLRGQEDWDVAAGSVFQLVQAIEQIHPGFADAADQRVLVAVDGELVTDWSQPLHAASQVLFVPRVGGG